MRWRGHVWWGACVVVACMAAGCMAGDMRGGGGEACVHPAGTSKESDKCDLSKNSEIAPFNIWVYGQKVFLPLILCHTGNLFQ